jgi:hypothetical protein
MSMLDRAPIAFPVKRMTANMHALSQRQSAHRDEIMTKEM